MNTCQKNSKYSYDVIATWFADTTLQQRPSRRANIDSTMVPNCLKLHFMICGERFDYSRKKPTSDYFFPTSHAFSTSKDYMARMVVSWDLTLVYCSVVVKC